MKEHTYGWYPSAKNVYTERRMGAPNEYQLEALYRIRDSKYYEPPMTPHEDRVSMTPTHDPSRRTPRKSAASDRKSASGMSRGGSRAMSAKSDQLATDAGLAMRVRSAPVHTRYKPPPRLNLPTPAQCWSTNIPETEITVFPPPAPTPAPSPTARPMSRPNSTAPYRPMAGPKSTTPHTPTPVPQPETPTEQPSAIAAYIDAGPGGKLEAFNKVIRIKSATVRRETPKRPPRSIKSAGPIRSPAPPTYTAQECDSLQPHPPGSAPADVITDTVEGAPPASPAPPPRYYAPSPASRPPSYRKSAGSDRQTSHKRTSARPSAPSPYKTDLKLGEDQDRTVAPDYDDDVRKDSWMMQIKGDPLKLKKVARRLPYTVKVDEPETERDPPKVYMENLETFFQNTIPRRPHTFAIDKEWISEMIHAKRMEHQKQHGVNYRYKNFSFVY